MLFPFAFPTRLATATSPQESYIYLHADQEYVVAVTEVSVQVWSGGQQRVRLGQVHLSQDDVAAFGTHVAAVWSLDRARLAVLTSANQVIVYGISVTTNPALPFPVIGPPAGPSARAAGAVGGAAAARAGLFLGEPRELTQVAIFAQDAAALPHDAPATAICADSRTLAVGFADGALLALSWSAKPKSELLDPLEEALDLRSQEQQQQQQQQQRHGEDPHAAAAASGADADGEAQLRARAIRQLAFAPSAGALAVVTEEGAVALCRTLDGALHPLDGLQFSHWLAGPAAGARCAALAAPLGLAAVGCASGEVLLVRLDAPADGGGDKGYGAGAGADPHDLAAASGSSPLAGAPSLGVSPFSAQPLLAAGGALLRGCGGAADDPALFVRALHLGDWGHTAAQTGGVSALAWSPDSRVLAVGYERQGLVVWSASGCRLMCTVRQQDAARTPRAGGGGGTAAAAAGTPVHGGAAVGAMDGGVQALAWGTLGYSLIAAATAPPGAGAAAAAVVALPEQAATPTAARSGAGAGGSQLLEVQLAKALAGNHRVAQVAGGPADESGGELHLLQAADRLLLISEASRPQWRDGGFGAPTPEDGSAAAAAGGGGGAANDLTVSHVPLPAGYCAANWPLVHAAASPSGGDVAVSGRRGLAVFSRHAERWRLFGDVSQERRVSCIGLGWLGTNIVVCSAPNIDPVSAATAPPPPPRLHSGGSSGLVTAGSGGLPGGGGAAAAGGGGAPGGGGSGGRVDPAAGCRLLVFPRRHLDFGSLVASHDLKRVPTCMDCVGNYVLVASLPLELLLLQFDPAHGRLVPLRELSIHNMGRPLQGLALVPPQTTDPSAAGAAVSTRDAAAAAAAAALAKAAARGAAGPRQAVLLRWGGALSVLDLDIGAELLLSSEVECFWLSSRLPVGPAGGSVTGGSSRFPSAPSSRIASRTASSHSLASAAAAAAVHGPLAAADSAAMAGGVVALREALGSLQLQQAGEEGAAGGDGEQQDPSVVEMPWWAYGPSGMQLWFPSLLPAAAPLAHAGGSGLLPLPPLHTQGSAALVASPSAAAAAAAAAAGPSPAASPGDTRVTDIELEFDREVYPVGVSLADASIVGVTQRLMRVPLGGVAAGHGAGQSFDSASDAPLALPSFHPAPESQPVLPALLRRLLLKGASAEALALAKRHEPGPHFARSLEWLLFTALDMEPSNGGKGRAKDAPTARGALGDIGKVWDGHSSGGPPRPMAISRLLFAAAELVLAFPGRSLEVVVSVARKTDAALWPALFTAVGSPSALLQRLLERGAHMSAACFLIVVDRLEGPHLAQSQALRLVRATLRRGQYPLSAEILRFMMPPGFKIPGPGAGGRSSAPGAAAAQGVVRFGGSGNGGGKAGRLACLPGGQQQQQQQQQQANGSSEPPAAAANGGGGWLGWLWGGGGAGAGAASAAAGGGPAPLSKLRAADSLDSGSGGSPWAGPRLSSSGGYRRSGLPGGATSAGGWEGLSEGGERGAEEACHLVSDHAWLLLEQGKHAQLAQLVDAMAFLPSGLAGLMGAYRDSYVAAPAPAPAAPAPAAGARAPSRAGTPGPAAAGAACGGGAADAAAAWWSADEAPPAAGELVAAVCDVVAELPVWESPGVEEDATRIMSLCRTLGAAKWGVALGVLLVDTPALAPYAAAHPALWAEFCAGLRKEPGLHFMGELIEALSVLPGGVGGGGADGAAAAAARSAAGPAGGGGAVAAAAGERQQQGGQGASGGPDMPRGIVAARAGVGSVSAMVQLG